MLKQPDIFSNNIKDTHKFSSDPLFNVHTPLHDLDQDVSQPVSHSPSDIDGVLAFAEYLPMRKINKTIAIIDMIKISKGIKKPLLFVIKHEKTNPYLKH